jgi:hypothetical protein
VPEPPVREHVWPETERQRQPRGPQPERLAGVDGGGDPCVEGADGIARDELGGRGAQRRQQPPQSRGRVGDDVECEEVDVLWCRRRDPRLMVTPERHQASIARRRAGGCGGGSERRLDPGCPDPSGGRAGAGEQTSTRRLRHPAGPSAASLVPLPS